jgi:hypothetical protein
MAPEISDSKQNSTKINESPEKLKKLSNKRQKRNIKDYRPLLAKEAA